MTYNGKCHCGKIAFDVEGDLTEIIECNCSICYESGYLHWMIDPSPAANQDSVERRFALSMGHRAGSTLLLPKMRCGGFA